MIAINILIVIVVLYIMACGVMYFFQEKFIFLPQRTEKGFTYQFDQPFEEKYITTNDGIILHGVLFKAKDSKGLIFYLHGKAGSLNSWGQVAKTYTDLQYDTFILDYRGYGKSEGKINGQSEFFNDIQTVYNELKKQYSENKIIVLGYSIGTGLASKLASTNKPGLLILQAPYYSMKDMILHKYTIIPSFIIKYKFETNKYLKDCKMPVIIFHGNQDDIIYYGSSLKLKEEYKKTVTLITLNGQGHFAITDNEDYKKEIQKILEVE